MENEPVIQPTNNTCKYLYVPLFLAIAGLILVVALTLIRSKADTSTQSAVVSNSTPAVDSVTVSSSSYGAAATSITLTENTTTNVYVWGTATDNNGCEDIDAASNYAMQFYRTNHASTSSCSADDNDCYRATSATVVDQCTAGGSDVVARYQFTVAMQYYADATDAGSANSATDWTARVIATDDSSAASTEGTDTVEVASLIALDVTSSIAYGSVALGATSAQQSPVITNTGNRNMDAQVSGDGAMTCTVAGSIPIGQVKWSLSNDFTYSSAGTALSTTPTTMNNSTAQRTGAASTTTTYWKIQIPATGISGTCTNTVTLTAIADA